MGSSDSKGQGHWTESSNVLREAERIRTQPMPRPVPQQPPRDPVTVDATPTHISATTGSAERDLGHGFYARAEGPNAALGARRTDSGGFRADAQVNAGGISAGHRNEHHDISAGLSAGRGLGGVEVHGGPKPGVTASIGPVTGSFRSTSLAQPVDPHTAERLKIIGSSH